MPLFTLGAIKHAVDKAKEEQKAKTEEQEKDNSLVSSVDKADNLTDTLKGVEDVVEISEKIKGGREL